MRPYVRTLVLSLVILCSAAPRLFAASWLWDQNQNRIDDRIESVQAGGLAAAHVNGDLNARLIFFVFPDQTPLAFGTYVGFDHMPTDGDVSAVEATGATILWRPHYIQYLRVKATFTQIQAIAALAGITRVEAWQVMYPFNDNATRTLRVRESAGGVGTGFFPSVWKDLGFTGKGVVVGILDSGVNDAPDLAYPGHESLVGKFLGGGNFSNLDSSLNTPPDSSANPVDHGAAASEYHGSHVAGTAIGSGGPQGILNGAAPGRYAGMAPEARLVDCKVITDAGVGGGAAEALEWCIEHRNTVWDAGEPGVTYRGVQVVNMSIGGTSASDGTDADCAAVNAAVKAGIVVCVATGNDGNTAYMPSPAAADQDVAVGALQDANTLQHSDDIVADYSNEGPRDSDGDPDHLDEMKPSVLGSGSDIVSVLGDPTTAGNEYQNINGTSMATPCITGICALIRQANPDLTPAEVRDVLQNTAEHRTDHGKQPPSASDPFSVDPNYHPSWGWGEVDAYAAVKEAMNRATTQVVSEAATGVSNVGGHLEITLRWVTQREVGVSGFTVYRAPDLGGRPGGFAPASPAVMPAGGPVIERAANRTPYTWTDTDASLVPGTPYWYEVRWMDTAGAQHVEPAFEVATDVPPVRVRVRWSITHNAIDNDIFARFGSGVDPANPAFVRPCGGSGVADSSVVVVPVGFGTMTRWYFHADLTDQDPVAGFLPPSNANPWFLSVREQGYVNTEGIVDDFSVTTYDENGVPSAVYTSPTSNVPTAEQQTTVLWIPMDPVTQANHAPVFDPVGDRTVGQGLTLNFQVQATDPDGQPVAYSALALPPGATFTPGSRTFEWTPSFSQSGEFTASFRAVDNFTIPAADTETVRIQVYTRAPGSDTAPLLAPISDKSTHEGMPLSFAVSAADEEGGALLYSAAPLPSGAAFDSSAGTFDWTPAYGAAGTYAVTFHVMDSGGAADSQSVTITVVSSGPTRPAGPCDADTTLFPGTIGADVQGAMNVYTLEPFDVPAGTQQVDGYLSWSGGPVVDLDLYLVDPDGNIVSSGATATADPEHAAYILPGPGTYQWKVVSYDNPNSSLAYTVTSIKCVSVAAGVRPPLDAQLFAMPQSQPNPFSRSSVIRFALPEEGPVKLRIYDVAGRLVRTLVDGTLEAGWHQRVWDGRSDAGERASTGMYFSRLEGRPGVRTGKLILIR